MSDVEAKADGAATGDVRGADYTDQLVLPPIDLQQLAAQQQFQLQQLASQQQLFAAQQQYRQPPPPNHSGGPSSIFGHVIPSHVGPLGAAGASHVVPSVGLGVYGSVCCGGLGYGVSFTSPAAFSQVSRTVVTLRVATRSAVTPCFASCSPALRPSRAATSQPRLMLEEGGLAPRCHPWPVRPYSIGLQRPRSFT
jgi:hypothetical protein